MALERIRAREADIRAFIAGLDKFLFRNLGDILSDLETGNVTGPEAAKVLGSLQTELKRLGLSKELGELQAIYGTELRAIRETFRDIGIKGQIFSDTDKDVIKSLITFDTSKTATNIERYVDTIKSVTMQTVLSGETPDFSQYHDRYGKSLEHVLDAELNTSLAAFDSSVTTGKAEELGLELFVYRGPDDKVTRPFCDACLNGGSGRFNIPARDVPIYTIDEIKAMNNEQDLDVLVYRGGYNCRHQWSPITEERAKELGYKG